mgnify:CR=1 FL=1
MRETELYPPVKALLEGQGFEVKGEVGACDVVATRPAGDDVEVVVVELKVAPNLPLLLQAVDRLALTESVYVGVAAGHHLLRKQRPRLVRLLRMLGLGLLVVEVDAGTVEVVLDPGPYRGRRRSSFRRQRLLGEFVRRVGDPNVGGAAAADGRVTAYRQRARRLADHLAAAGPCRARDVAEAVGDPGARDVLYRDVYGWFERVERGIYDLSPRGRREVAS